MCSGRSNYLVYSLDFFIYFGKSFVFFNYHSSIFDSGVFLQTDIYKQSFVFFFIRCERNFNFRLEESSKNDLKHENADDSNCFNKSNWFIDECFKGDDQLKSKVA